MSEALTGASPPLFTRKHARQIQNGVFSIFPCRLCMNITNVTVTYKTFPVKILTVTFVT